MLSGGGEINQIHVPHYLPEERGHRCPLFRRVFGPKNQRYYINLLFLLGNLVNDSTRTVSFKCLRNEQFSDEYHEPHLQDKFSKLRNARLHIIHSAFTE